MLRKYLFLLLLASVPISSWGGPDVLNQLQSATDSLLIEAVRRVGLEADDLSLRQAQAIVDERYARQRDLMLAAGRNYLTGLWHYRQNELAAAERPLATAYKQFLKLHASAAAGETALLLGWSRWRLHDTDAAERWLRRAVRLLPPDDASLQLGCFMLAGALHPEIGTARAAAPAVDLLTLLQQGRRLGTAQATEEAGLPAGLVAGGALSLLVVGGFLFLRYKKRQRTAFRALAQQNEIIQQQKEELLAQSEKLRQQRDELNVTIQQMLDAYAELRELSKFKDALTGMIVHDLKSPLNAILINASMQPDQPAMVLIHQAARQMLNLTLNLLDVQRYENSQLPVKRMVVDLYQLCRDAIDQVIVTARQKQMRIELQGATRLQVDFDPDLAVRVLVNLLTNAIKYSPAGSRVQVRAEVSDSNNLRLTVRDEGPGIPVQFRESIFDKYVQFKQPDVPKNGLPSTGLGLTFCRMAIEAHGGRIWVEDPASGPGSVFVIDLPEAILPDQDPPATEELVFNLPEIFEWTDARRAIAYPLAQQLVDIEPYQLTRIQEVIEKLPDDSPHELRRWAEAILDSALAGNALRYRQLVVQPLWENILSPKI